jgi:hypothetical protein
VFGGRVLRPQPYWTTRWDGSQRIRRATSMTVVQLMHRYQAQAGLVLGQWPSTVSDLHTRQVIASTFRDRRTGPVAARDEALVPSLGRREGFPTLVTSHPVLTEFDADLPRGVRLRLGRSAHCVAPSIGVAW